MHHYNILNKKTVTLFAAIFCITEIFCQGVEMPKMPQMPTMPEMPSVGGGFYKPEVPKYKKETKTEQKSTTTKTNENGLIKNQTPTLTEDTSANDLLNFFANDTSFLTATDISSLYDAGLFNNISSLDGTSISSASSNILLQQILTSLQELKEDRKYESDIQKEALANKQLDNQTFKNRNPLILRFKINGYSITESFTKVFFSETEADGSFILTADRKYFVNQQVYKETVYFLFRTVKSNGSVTTYEVIPSISQDTKNENSYLCRMSKEKKLVAEKTGNFVVLHHSNNNLQIDLLLDIDNK